MTVLNCKCRRNGWQCSRRMRGGRQELRKPDRLGCHIRQMRSESRANHLSEVKKKKNSSLSQWGEGTPWSKIIVQQVIENYINMSYFKLKLLLKSALYVGSGSIIWAQPTVIQCITDNYSAPFVFIIIIIFFWFVMSSACWFSYEHCLYWSHLCRHNGLIQPLGDVKVFPRLDWFCLLELR